ncbi:hypothetical protein Z046_26345 [Pseudomonas aeruginosa VRFPA09]|jgi:hypothetical protein|uniref:hypothetical protein n=1 Tax=Gammaproteobacteria TaxID=1236 RepID=UPI00044BADFB|nr:MULTISPECIES: hypothetical protein [Gammaproteobacteria]EVT87821.1 hypothetical protein Z046_26345 [Pseudomonas aeruginosa VRFPA09]OYW91710.1 MAG: hypothetical protein B7Z23_07555 [Pseudomonadales bacterium 32-61-5]KAB0699540.1 hypothetical protein F7O89_05620 [Pseudomonas aeruginosa]MBG4443732.1 hypothetical protein [Pseudomonas aeruginosa]MBH4069623.1 hypothetical protein [Pseudomonas aeruginosa]
MQIRSLLIVVVATSASLASTFVMAHPGGHDSDDNKLIPKTCEQLANTERYITDVAYPEVRELKARCDAAKEKEAPQARSSNNSN